MIIFWLLVAMLVAAPISMLGAFFLGLLSSPLWGLLIFLGLLASATRHTVNLFRR